jgi:hypothetical protein
LAKVKIDSYDPTKTGEESEWEGEQLGWFNMVTRYSNFTDYLLLWSGLIGAACFGAAMPGFCYYFGTMIDESAKTSVGDKSTLDEQSYYMVGIGGLSFFFSWW